MKKTPKLTKLKRGRKRKYDFSDLKKGDAKPLTIHGNGKPYAYLTYWNKHNPGKRVEVAWDEDGKLWARRV